MLIFNKFIISKQLSNELNNTQTGSATFAAALENGSSFHIPQFQIYTTGPVYHQANDTSSTSKTINNELV